ncbi:AzlD domain-containing protein [Arsenicicoccus piscis]|uniref:Branched-chain amino acid transporter AzlD n=2 Tax=Arsenicicoccus piscis TaxID=673954 RepID=A0ABQ6HS35_9MICO|nr:AzlD domain-containing protein [Arsenicicoccus piscis]MCH8626375.1 AzlD domain-containing protein [Arsenicicoccus piscis]MCH8629318.1 AzlD domain-containing protein [Arsenicicoccus piscis]GMA20992.1 branched-chain amino acid transporter AzlD [Arsenicicoccus piscis]
MSLTNALLLSCLLCYATKLVGFLVPDRHLEHPLVGAASATMTAGLLAALVATNTFVAEGHLTVDARVVSLAVASLALWLRAPFIVVVILGAAAAAATRALGWG